MSTSKSELGAGYRPRIALTSGEPAGIGPELCAQLAARGLGDADVICLGDQDLLRQRARCAGVELDATPLIVSHQPLAVPSVAGQLDVRNAGYVISLLDHALQGLATGDYDAMVTAPVQKSVIAESGVRFSGHTEYLAEKTGGQRSVMMLVADELKVALATTHLPLRQVPDALSMPALCEILEIMNRDLKSLWGISKPRIAVTGLNPHAGENGLLGSEEQTVIGPAIERARTQGIDAFGPIPADTAFVPREMTKYDAILAMYHDQGLPVLKHAGFGAAINVTLGLPIIRTSVDHGTALSLAGSGKADVGSLAAALDLAIDLVQRKRQIKSAHLKVDGR